MSTKKLQIIGNFGGNSIEIDDTLTRIGHAADAKATGDAINQLQANVDNVANIVNNLDDTHYTESEIDSMMTDLNAAIDAKSDSNHIHDDLYYTETEIDAKLGTIQSDLDSKVDAVDGKGLSTNDYTDEEQQKLRDIESGANYYEHPAHSSHDLGLYKVTVDDEGHVSEATAVEKEDILAFVEKDDIVNLGFMDEDSVSSEISDLNDRIDGVEGNLNTTNETLNGLSEEFENYKTTNNGAVSTNASAIEANKTAIKEIKDDYLTSTDKTQLQDGISQVSEKATANATAIEILNGEGNGSVKQSIDNAFNEFAAKISDDKVVNTYKELIDYADEHGAQFTTLVGNVANISDRVGDIESDISDYKTTVSNQFAEIDTMIDNHINDTQEALQGKADSEHMHEIGHIDSLQDLLDELRTDIDTNAEDIDTKANLEHEHSDLYYDKDEIEQLVTVEDIDDICGSNVIIGGGDANVVSYATKQWVQDGYQPKGNYLTSVPDGYATESYVDTKISEIQTADVSGQINTHNLATDAHNDIRLLVDGLTTRLNTLADCDDTTLDQMSEVVEYIKSNQSLIEGITTKKVNVADIIDDLTTNVSNKPLSAAQGVILKGLIDELTSNLSNYQPKGDYLTAVPAGYATEEFVTAKIAEAELGGEPGTDGKSAYAYAQDGGYTGTEEEFATKLAAGSLTVSLYNATDEGVFDADHTPDECGKAFSDGVAIYVNAVYENREYAGPVCTVLLEEDGFCVVTANLFNLDNAADMMSVIGYTDEGWALAAPPVTYASTADIPDVAPFVITVTGNDTDGYALDKTGEEIEAAYAAGRRLCCNLRKGVSPLIDALPLFYRNTIQMPVGEGFAVSKYVYNFKYMSGASTTTVSFGVNPVNNTVVNIKVATTGTNNNFPLIINDLEYDGSKAVTVDTRGFTFNATGSQENGYTIDTTYVAIFTHLAQGRSVNCLFNGEFFVGFILPLLMLDVENEAIVFGSSPMPGTSVMLSIMSDGSVECEEILSAIQIGEQYYDFYGDADFTDTINGMIDAKAYSHPSTHPASMITGLATVATSGKYSDLSDIPTIPTIPDALKNPNALIINGTSYDGSEGKNISGLATETYVDNQIATIPTPDVSGQINTHNTATDSHNDIRLLIEGLTTRLNTLADSDDTTLDQMGEVVAYIKNNKSLIDGITTNKVNVADIINNLTTNVTNKPLSAAQGVALKALIDALDDDKADSEHAHNNYASTVTMTGSGNAITSISQSGNTITATKGSTFLTAHPTISKSTDTTSTANPAHDNTFTAIDSITRDSNGHVTKVNTKTISLPEAGLHYVANSEFTVTEGSSTSGAYLATKWTASGVDGITTPTDGMSIAIRTPAAGCSGGILLSIDGGSNYFPIVRNVNTLVTTYYPAGSTIMVTFNSTQTASPYVTSNTKTEVTGCWQIADYDANTKTSSGTSNKVGAKMYLVGATSQNSSGVTTYSNKNCYIGTDNRLYSNGKRTVTLDDTLKNPYAVTVGDVTYDGSAAVDMTDAVNALIDARNAPETEQVLSDNLLDKSLLTLGQCFYYGGSGYQLASSTYTYYGFIPLRGAGTYRTKFQKGIHSSTGTRIALVDDNNTWVVNATGTLGEVAEDNNWVDFEFVVTQDMISAGATKIAFDVYSPYLDKTMIVKDRDYPSEYIPYGYIEVATDSGKKQDNVLCGKTAVFLGDSICAGTTVGDIAEYGYGWAGLIGEANHMNWTNYGKNGGTITHRGSDGTCIAKIADRAISEHPTADYIIFEGGCNDADQMKESGLGEISTDYATFDTTTFSGALESLILKLVTAYPYARIGYIIPPKMYTGYADYTAANHIHRKYFDRAVEICQKWGIPVVDLWNGSPLNPKLSTANIYYSDGIQHLTLAGYQRITPQIEAFMRNL